MLRGGCALGMNHLPKGKAPTCPYSCAKPEPSVIIARRPCALLPEVKPLPPLVVDSDKCVGCKMCMRIGCPAIRVTDGKAAIDPTLCVGCDLCIQMCRPGAIGKNQEV